MILSGRTRGKFVSGAYDRGKVVNEAFTIVRVKALIRCRPLYLPEIDFWPLTASNQALLNHQGRFTDCLLYLFRFYLLPEPMIQEEKRDNRQASNERRASFILAPKLRPLDHPVDVSSVLDQW